MSQALHPVDSEAALVRWATLSVEEVLRELGGSPHGLREDQAREQRAKVGTNSVAEPDQEGLWRQLLGRLINPLNILLAVLAGVSWFSGNQESGVVILLMVGLSVSLGLWQERRSGRAAAALRAMVHTTATVLRPCREDAAVAAEDERLEVPIESLVPGDVIHLSAGDLVPADVRLLSAKDFFVNESALTGESLPVEKYVLCEPPGVEALRLRNTCYMGTHVASGSALAVVVQTGARATFGAIASVVSAEHVATSFDLGLSRFTWLMLRFMAVMVPLVFLINGLTKGDWMEALLFATAVAVGLTPEMLPMLVTVNLAKGALTMSRKKVIVKRLNAIQNLGAMDILCTDKTGTLTQDRIILERYVDVDGQPSDRVLELAYLNSYYQSGLKNLLDVAVLKYNEVHERLHEGGHYRKVDEIPFDFMRRRMSVVVEGQGERLLICKGAVEEVFSVCTQGERQGVRFALDPSHLGALQDASRLLNEEGFRVIAIAYKRVEVQEGVATAHDESELVLLGYIAFLDPPKDSAREALRALTGHGLQVKILTGDNEIVTRKVCRDVGLTVEGVLLGHDIEAMTPEQLADAAEATQVFAKLSPMQKARVIEALRGRGHVVGFLGDGINDGPALKAADVGVSVDTAVDIAKESADIILLEKSLLVLDDGVSEGRKVFANILKYIRMGASSNFGNVLSVLGASAFLPFLPMAPIQVLTNNLLYDVSQTAIPTDQVDQEYLASPRRWEIGNIARFMLMMGPVSSVFDYLTFALMIWGFQALAPGGEALFHTGWLVESLLSQTVIIHVIRTSRLPFVQSRASTPLMWTSLAVCAVGVYLPYSPLAPSLGLVALPWAYWPALALILLSYMGAMHLMKRWFARRYGWH